MESENSELQFLDFTDLSEEEVKKIKDILKVVNKVAHVELPWDITVNDDSVSEGASELPAVYVASTLPTLHSHSVSTVPIPEEGVFPPGGYQVTGSLSHTDSLPINSSLPVTSPPFVPQSSNLPPVTNVSHYPAPQGFPFDIRALPAPFQYAATAATHLGVPLVRHVNPPGSQDIAVYQPGTSVSNYPPGQFSNDGLCQSEKNADGKLDDSLDLKKRASGDKRKARRGRGGRTIHTATPYYSADIGAPPVESYGQTAVLQDEVIPVNIQTGTALDVAQSQQLPSVPTTVTQSLSAASLIHYPIQQPFTVSNATLPIPGPAAPPASSGYPPGMTAIPFAQLSNHPQPSPMYFVSMYPPMFSGYIPQPSATSPVVTSGPTVASTDVICQSNNTCPAVPDTSATSLTCQQEQTYSQTERTVVSTEIGSESVCVNNLESPTFKSEDEKSVLEANGSEESEKQIDSAVENESNKDDEDNVAVEGNETHYNSSNCSVNEVDQIATHVSEIKINDNTSGMNQTSVQDDIHEKESVSLSMPTSMPNQQKSWADLFKKSSSSSSPTDVRRVSNANTIMPPPVSPLTCNSVEREEPANNNVDAVGQTVPPHEDKLAKKLGKYLLQFHPNHATRYIQPRGLINRSNWCYINATLQALIACPPLYNLLKGIIQHVGIIKREKSSTPIVDSLVDFVKNFSHMQPIHKLKKKEELVVGQPFEPESIYHMLNITKSDCAKGRQEDAEEFLSFVLNGLHEEMYAVIQTVQDEEQKCNGDLTANGHGEDSGDEGVWRLMGKKNKSMLTRSANLNPSPISRIFGGQMRSVLKTGGRETSANLQPFFTLQLEIQSEKVESVKEALSQMTAMELIHGYTNSKGEVVDAERQITLEELPLVLILHFKWFVYDQDGGCKKLMKKMDYSIDLEIDKDVLSNDVRSKVNQKHRSYKLFAVVYHEGKEAVKGHYVADVYHSGSGGWLRCDDKSVTPVQDNQVLKYSSPRVPYLLFYRRLDTAQRNYNSDNAASYV